MMASTHSDTAAGTLGGVLLSAGLTIDAGDLLRTVILASVGAMVSYGVSRVMRRVLTPSPSPKGEGEDSP